LNNTEYTIYPVSFVILMDRKIGIIYKKFQFKLKIDQDTIDYAQKLHENLIEKNPFKYESPYLIVPICIFTVSRISEQPKSLGEMAEVSHIKEDDLRKCYDMVFGEIDASLKKL
jgi:transcription initiation factor TFIIIB Brf1 subunit/transcription initiation factor TFIIB